MIDDEKIEAEVKRRLAEKDRQQTLNRARQSLQAAAQSAFAAANLYRSLKLTEDAQGAIGVAQAADRRVAEHMRAHEGG